MRQRARGCLAAVVLALCGLGVAGAPACTGEVVTNGIDQPSPLEMTPETGDLEMPGTEREASPQASTNDDPPEDNGQTGALEPAACGSDLECVPDLAEYAGGDAEYVLLDSACEHAWLAFPPFSSTVTPECVCDVSVTRSVRDRSTGEVSRQTFEELHFLANDERRALTSGPRCLIGAGEVGVCAYCDHEFPGCDVDAAMNDCAAPCADAVERLRAAEQVAHDVELRVARCTEYGNCQVALRIDDDCYNQGWIRSSCSLSDEEIIAAEGERPNAGEQCALPPPACATSEDCPAGLACNGSICGACLGPDDACITSETGGCQNDAFVCGSGESCIAGFCILDERAECVASADCPTTDPGRDPRVCLLSDIGYQSGRGNEETRSFCSTPYPNLFGLRVGDVLEVRVLGSADSVASMFEPSLSSRAGACGEGTGLVDGAISRVRMEWLAGSAYESDYWPRATLIDIDAPVEPMPPPAHPRDPARGRQLFSKLGSPANYSTLAYVALGEPTTLRGCPGTRYMSLISLLDSIEPGQPPRQDGTFPTTVLNYVFNVNDESIDDPACAAFPEFDCAENLHVELTRLTP